MHLRAAALVLSARAHGETGSVVRLLTEEFGVVAGYVAGGRGRRMRPVVLPGNRVSAELRAKSDSQLPFARLELETSRAPFLTEALPAAAITWACALTATTLPEHNPYPRIHSGLDGLLDAIGAAPSARGWLPGMIAYERLLLRELGYGEARLPVPPDSGGQLDRLKRQGRAIEHYLLADTKRDVMAARTLMVERLQRMLA